MYSNFVFETVLNTAHRLMFVAAELGIQMPAGQAPAIAPPAEGGVVTQVVYTPAAQASEPSMWPMLLVWGAVFVGMYFLMFRPQRKREKQMKEMQASIKSGDNIVTTGGLFGKITDVGTDSFIVEFGVSGRSVRMPVLKTDVLGVREPIMTPPPKEES